jgi:1-acyl-sn-glycerol-3-phosphate acyltransferase
MPLTRRDILILRFQRALGRLAFPVLGLCAIFYMRWLRRNRVENLDALRRAYREALGRGRPTIICANHLTLTDSFYLHYAFGSIPAYFFRWRLFSWNVPAVENFTHTLRLRLMTYLFKCVAIDRAGSSEHHAHVFGKLRWLLERGDAVTIFPEGTRSRTGRIDPERVTYGVGSLLKDLSDPIVICAYVRGDRQETWSDYPSKGDVIRIDLEVLEPQVTTKGMRAARDIARQIITKLKAMEDRRLSPCSSGLEEGADLA